MLRNCVRAARRRAVQEASRGFRLNFGTVDFEVGLEGKSGYFEFGTDTEVKGLARERARPGNSIPLSKMSSLLHELLKDFWGYDEFKPGQLEVIEKLLGGEDVIATMPTGHGKSLLYQLPPLAMGKPSLVISPLIALMEEQVIGLKQRGITAAYSGKGDAYQQDWDTLDVLFMSPEAVTKQIGRIAHTDFGLVAIDEAHCVSEWGIQFRPTYRSLSVLRETHPHVPMLAITASATEHVVSDIRDVLYMKDPALVTHSFNRPNLHYTVLPKDHTTREKVRDIVMSESCSIIYCMTIKQCEALHSYLVREGVSVALYHGDMDIASRMTNQRAFMYEDVNCIVCTVAFGMGIDKPNVRHVIHMGHCKSLTDYYQQTGRAGRDGAPSRCTMFISVADVVNKGSFLLNGLTETHAKASLNDISALIEFCELDAQTCRRVPLLAHFNESYQTPKEGCGGCDNCDTLSNDNIQHEVDITELGNQILRMAFGIKFATSLDKMMATFMGESKGYKLNKYYGYGKGHTKRHVSAVMDQLRMEGYLKRSLLQLQEKKKLWLGWEISEKGKELVFDHRYTHFNEIKVVKPTLALLESMKEFRGIASDVLMHQQRVARRMFMEDLGGEAMYPLFEKLKELRKVRSREMGIAPSHYVPESSLVSMVQKLPSTAESFSKMVINVPKNFKDAQYFVDQITEFCEANELSDRDKSDTDRVEKTKPPPSFNASSPRDNLKLRREILQKIASLD
eukprot:TRINITY_DN1963_c0_g1_i2.p1 TRINITY_DN1963_c0_g1~~TRINITY_DN1963_c0_g1_i2.p1  ORF type:complete len:735 (+),score=232.84 TRINITY_DN1963_c0_g1_i2:52-2256(+)